MRQIESITLHGNGFVVNFMGGDTQTYNTGRRSDIYLRRNPRGLYWTEPRQSFDVAANSSVLENYIIRSERRLS